MRTKIESIVRIALGLMLVVFGLNKFLQFMPPFQLPEQAQAFFSALFATGYFIPFLAVAEIVIGVLFLINKAKPLAIVMLTPITINILLFHLALDIVNIGGAALLSILHITLIFIHKQKLMFLICDKHVCTNNE